MVEWTGMILFDHWVCNIIQYHPLSFDFPSKIQDHLDISSNIIQYLLIITHGYDFTSHIQKYERRIRSLRLGIPGLRESILQLNPQVSLGRL